MRYFSLFSGIGGFEYGMESVNRGKNRRSQENSQTNERQGLQSSQGEKVGRTARWDDEQPNRRADERAFTCIGYSETDKYASAIYRYRYPEHRNFGDATAIVTSDIPDFDLLVAGFPCQAFSIAGKRQGFMDSRGTLFFEIARILADKRPRYFLLENVAGLLSHDDRRTFVRIIGILSDIGYRVQWQILNSKDHSVPQNRERVFIIGHLGEKPRPEVFPISEGGEWPNQPQTEAQGDGSWIRGNDSQSPLRTGEGCGHFIAVGSGTGSTARGQRFVANAITGSYYWRENLLEEMAKVRRLTPIECERLQGFPDGWTEYGIIDGKKVKISDTQRYKCLGNAVTTNVITKIINQWREK